MKQFKKSLQERLTELAVAAVGDPTQSEYVRTFDDHLRDVDLTELPFVVITVRQREKEGEEINKWDLHSWTVHIYYLDTEQDWTTGATRRDDIMDTLNKALEKNKFLQDSTGHSLDITDTDGHREYVWKSEITNVLFDESGQEGYYSFVSELYMTIHTAQT